jgi:hypothetical protein
MLRIALAECEEWYRLVPIPLPPSQHKGVTFGIHELEICFAILYFSLPTGAFGSSVRKVCIFECFTISSNSDSGTFKRSPPPDSRACHIYEWVTDAVEWHRGARLACREPADGWRGVGPGRPAVTLRSRSSIHRHGNTSAGPWPFRTDLNGDGGHHSWRFCSRAFACSVQFIKCRPSGAVPF